MKQALGIARGILHDPSVLLMDEPTQSLSPDVAGKVRKLIRNKAKTEGKTILIASHNLKEAEELADRISIIHHGVIKAIGSLSDLKTLAGISPSSDLHSLFEHFTRNH
jgi:ABC-2 type transport system ATP-binding protein